MKALTKNLFLIATAVILLILNGCGDACEDTTCRNNGICVDGTCECPLFYEGDFCEDEVREKYLGTYFGTLEAPFYTSERYFTLLRDDTGVEYLSFDGLIIILTSNTEFSFEPNQVYDDIDFDIVRVDGYGEFIGDSIQGELVYVDAGSVVAVLEMNLLKQ